MTTKSKTLVEKEVERLFAEMDARRGNLCRNPVTGAEFVWGVDPIAPQKKEAARALLARAQFAASGPPDAPPLPLSDEEIEDCRGAGGLASIVGFYARSLDANEYDFEHHPSFEDFARGLMASDSGFWGIEKDVEMRKRFPPRPLNGMGPGLYWEVQRGRKRVA